MSKFLSIAIPSYEMKGNGSIFLDFSLQKLSEQSFQNFEVVISDHSQNYDVKNICDKWSNILDIKYLKFEDKLGSSSANINNAISNSSGQWIKILFQDDFIFDYDSLQKIHDHIVLNPDIKWIASACEHSNDGLSMYRTFYPEWNDSLHLGKNTISSPSVITIKNSNDLLFDDELVWLMDVDFYKKMYDRYGEPSYIYDILVVNRTWGDRLSDNISQEIKSKELDIIKKRYTMDLENNGERMDINYYNMNYNNFDMYQKSHYKRYEFLKTIVKSTDIVGDMACGSGYGSMMISEVAKEVSGFDIDSLTIEEIIKRYQSQGNINFNQINLLDLNYSNHFDKIVSFETVEHFDPSDISILIKNFHKSLKEDGYLIFSTPYNQEDSIYSRKFHRTFHIVEDTILSILDGLFTLEKVFYQNYSHHDLVTSLDYKNFIICVAKKI